MFWAKVVLFSVFATTALAKKTFVYCSEGSPSIFNPQLASDGPTFNASSRAVYNRLVDFKTGSTELVPSLAEKWASSDDSLKFTFYLRKGVSFHSIKGFKPTRAFNADDVIFTFERMRNPKHAYHKVNGGSYEYFNSMGMGELIKEIKKVDDHTVEFHLTRPEAPFVANLGMGFASILSAEYGAHLLKKKTPEKMDIYPVGTGPFVFKKYVKDTLIRYTANGSYFAGAPKIDKLVFAITPDQSVRTQKLKTGECHLIAEPAPMDLPGLEKIKGVKVSKAAGLNVGYLAFNTEKKPFDNVKVRRAIHHALNRAAYVKAIYLGNATIAKNPIPPSMWSYNDSVKDYNYNVEMAKKLLAEAGYPKGFETTLWTLPVSRPYNPNGKKMGELMQADLAKIGIKVKLVTFDWPTYLARAKKGEHDMIQIGWTGDNGDPDNFLNVLLGCDGVKAGSNFARWCHKDFSALVDKARTLRSQSERAKLYEQAQTVFKREAPWVTLVHSTVYRAFRDKVKGYKIHPLGTERFSKLQLD